MLFILNVILLGAVIYLFVNQQNLKSAIQRLERRGGADLKSDPIAKNTKTPRELPLISDEKTQKVTSPTPKPGKLKQPGQTPHQRQDVTSPPQAIVFRQDKISALFQWLGENWFYAVSAVSLALAGIFLVQYSIENALIPPMARILIALVFGAGLVGVGEWLRRCFGDDESVSTAYLPSTFSSAGIVTLFGAILGARMLYDLIGPNTALGAMVIVAVLAIVLGWFYGPLLAVVGIIGAMAAPFLIGGESEDPSGLFAYFAVVALTGLFVDSIRRWAWVSVLSISAAFAAGVLLYMGDAQAGFFAVYLTGLVFASICVPMLSIVPKHQGTSLFGMLTKTPDMPWPEFPTRLAGATTLVACILMSLLYLRGAADFWLTITCLTALMLGLIIWAKEAPALEELTVLPALVFMITIFSHSDINGSVYSAFVAEPIEGAEQSMPMQATILLIIALLTSLAAAWRSFGWTARPAVWAAGAAVFAPAVAILLEFTWQPAAHIGAYPWALHAVILAAVMVFTAERFAKRDGDDKLRASFAVLSALSSISFALFIVLSSVALTISLSVMVLAAAALDRKFNLRPMGIFISAGVIVLGYRVVIDPGLDFAIDRPIFEAATSMAAPLIAFVAALQILRHKDRPVAKLMLDSAAFSAAGIFTSIMLFRFAEWQFGGDGIDNHWGMGSIATVWLSLMLAQIQRLPSGAVWIKAVRIILIILYALIATIFLLLALTLFNPLVDAGSWFDGEVLGPPLLNTLLLAYLFPAIVLGIGVWRIKTMSRWLKWPLSSLSIGLASLWLALVIRHFWQGADGMDNPGTTQPELYSYTVALLVIGAVLFFRALAKQSAGLRRAGLIIIGLAVAKVFFVDISELVGLMRVFSFLALGLSLAGLAWLNRWVQKRMAEPTGA
ncbi:DUF2339 domain-containing protein [Pseudaestuariivita rosea]|uniref:DUF2339 domain-containing protein n=1 Tax=Pseudaestuariivita rosea TaxID=2763263 RepID=UPI001ABB3C77|nr:DUF2339 domain-containing protein [Pseudaestuariivita rosea]